MLVKEGESKIIEYSGDGLVKIKLKPTVYSYTHNRASFIEGSDKIRLQSCEVFHDLFIKNSIDHTYVSFGEDHINSWLVYEPTTFIPNDLTKEQINLLPKFCPIEVVVKKLHVGTPKHRYYNIEKYPLRKTYGAHTYISANNPYPDLMIRFDWRNPNVDDKGNRLCDEVMSEDFADYYINVENAKSLALKTFVVIEEFLKTKGIELIDICLFIDEDGNTIFSEVSPDCMRVTSKDEGSLDKDIWRAGGSSPLLLEKWQRFVDLIS